MKRLLNFLATALATTALSAGLMLAPTPAFAGVATLTGATGTSCDYTAVSIAPNGDITVTCGSTGSTATINIGTVGSLDAGLPSNVPIPVSCTGTGCSGVEVSVAINPARTGVSLIGVTTHTFASAGSQNFTVAGDGTTTIGNATFEVTLTSQGTATSTSPLLNGTKTKSIPIVDATAPGTLTFSPSVAAVTEGGPAITVSVLRTGSGAQAGTATVQYSCSVLPTGYTPGFSPAASGTLTWTGSDATAKTISITPTTVPDTVGGTVTCTLGGTTGGAIPDPGQFVLTVNKASGGSSCPTVADVNYDLSISSDTNQTFRLASLKTAAIKFSGLRTRPIVSANVTYPAPGENPPNGFQFAVSQCPGDFTNSQGSGCVAFSPRASATLAFGSACTLDPTKKYYLNVRFVNPSTGASTCKTINCGAYINLSY